MMYCKNKDSFRKNIQPKEHKQASRNIIECLRKKNSNNQQVPEKDKNSKYQSINQEQFLTNIYHPQNKIMNQSIKLTSSIKNTNNCNFQHLFDICLHHYQNNICHNQVTNIPINSSNHKNLAQDFQNQIYNSYEQSNSKYNTNEVYNSPERNSLKSKKIDVAQKIYIQVLEQKNCQLNEQLKTINNQIQCDKIKIQLGNLYNNKKRYEQFYQKGRNLLISSSMELIQCKNHLNYDYNHQDEEKKLASINRCLAQNQELIQVYRNLLSEQNPYNKMDILQQANNRLQEYEILTSYHEKTIKYLRNQDKKSSPINQIALLRYEINRISQDNENLRAKIHDYQNNQEKLSYWNKYKPIQSNKSNTQSSKSTKKKVQETQDYDREQIDHLQNQLKNSNEQCFKLKVEKEYLLDLYTSEQTQNQKLIGQINKLNNYEQKNIQYQKVIQQFTQQNQLLKQQSVQMNNLINFLNNQVHQLKQSKQNKNQKDNIKSSTHKFQNSSKHNSKQNSQNQSQHKELLTIEDVCKYLNKRKSFQYYLILKKSIEQYEEKISIVNEQYMKEKMLKDRIFDWGKTVYQIIRAQDRKSILGSSIEQFQNILKQIPTDKIQHYLIQIKAMTIGIDMVETHEMEEQLKQYVKTLKGRLPALRQIDFEDGSSVSFDMSINERHTELDIYD